MCDECYCQIPPFSILKQNMNCEVEEFHGISFIFLLVVPRRIHNMQILNDFCLKSPCVYLCVCVCGAMGACAGVNDFYGISIVNNERA